MASYCFTILPAVDCTILKCRFKEFWLLTGLNFVWSYFLLQRNWMLIGTDLELYLIWSVFTGNIISFYYVSFFCVMINSLCSNVSFNDFSNGIENENRKVIVASECHVWVSFKIVHAFFMNLFDNWNKLNLIIGLWLIRRFRAILIHIWL